MMKSFVIQSLTAYIISSSAEDGWEVKKNDEGRMVQQMKVEAPSLSEEDQWGHVMPDAYRCDSCKAVVYQLNQALKKRQIKSRRMHEWEYNELFEETCNVAFEGYGIKLIDGKNALSGAGLKQPESISTGGAFIQMSGKGWSNRLSEICRSIVYDKVGEDELYQVFYTNHKIPESICYDELAQCGNARGSKSQKTKTGTKKAKTTTKVISGDAKINDLSKVDVKTNGAVSQANKTGPGSVEAVDADSFLKSLALEDGLELDAYSSKRSRQEWEKLVVAMAGKIYSRQV